MAMTIATAATMIATHTLAPLLCVSAAAALGPMLRKLAYPPLPNGGRIELPFGLGIWM